MQSVNFPAFSFVTLGKIVRKAKNFTSIRSGLKKKHLFPNSLRRGRDFSLEV